MYKYQVPTFVVAYIQMQCILVFVNFVGPADIESREPVVVGEWITIVAERSRQDGSLSVNNGVAVKGW